MNNDEHDIHMKRVSLDPSMLSSDELIVIEVMGADSLDKLLDNEELSGKKTKSFRRLSSRTTSTGSMLWISGR